MQPSPTVTPLPSPTRQIDVGELVERIPFPEAGFSFLPPISLRADLAQAQATLANVDQTFLLSLAAGPMLPELSLEDALSSFLGNMAADIPDLDAGEITTAEIAGAEAVACDIAGTAFGGRFNGRITVMAPPDGPPLYVLALAMEPPLGNGWAAEGEALYTMVLDSVEFFAPRPGQPSCAVSTDPTYGFEQANPVRVGGDAFGGPARARAFLDNLRGPEGEPVAYERTGSITLPDTILDAYSLSYPGLDAPVTVYLDEYSFEPLYAPVGFTCAGPFPVTPP
jgi:hypothetical protein